MIKLSLLTPLPPDEQAAADAWLDVAARAIEAEVERRWFNLCAYGCTHPEMWEEKHPGWPPKLAPPVTDS